MRGAAFCVNAAVDYNVIVYSSAVQSRAALHSAAQRRVQCECGVRH